jgi:hypothetical protein
MSDELFFDFCQATANGALSEPPKGGADYAANRVGKPARPTPVSLRS